MAKILDLVLLRWPNAILLIHDMSKQRGRLSGQSVD